MPAAAADAAGIDVRSLRRVLLATSGGGDILGPASANAVIHKLGLDHRCDGFDVTNACMGFLSALVVGARSVATGLGPVGVVASEVMSRGLRPDWPRPWVVFSDAAAAAILVEGRPGEGLLGIHLANDGSLPRTVYVEHPLHTQQMEWLRMDVPNRDFAPIVVDALSRSAQAVLGPAGQTLASVDWVLPHQPNGAMLEEIVRALGIPPEKIVPVVQDIGNPVCVSIPVSLDRLFRTRPVKPGDRILMIGIGSGISYGAALYRVAPA
jgi:3-oxoacyl-[acyl-carrier-protein] synthase III